MSTPPTGPGDVDDVFGPLGRRPGDEPRSQQPDAPAEAAAPAPAPDETAWMPGPGDPATWEPPVDDTGLLDPADAPTVAFGTPAAPAPWTPAPPAPPTAVTQAMAYEQPTAAYSPFGPPPPGPEGEDAFPEPGLFAGPAEPEPPAGPGRRGGPDGPGEGAAGNRTKWIAAAVAAALIAAAAGIGIGMLGGDDETPAATPTPAATSAAPSSAAPSSSEPATTSATTTTTKAVEQIAITDFDARSAQTWVRNAGASPKGELVEAWTYSDANGTNVLLQTYEVTHRYAEDDERAPEDSPDPSASGATPSDGATASATPTTTPSSDPGDQGAELADAATSRIYLVAAKEGEEPKVLRTITDDNGGLCENDFTAEFTPGSVAAQDTDGDGVAEVTVGWYSACRGDPGPMNVKLAVLSGKKKLILRGLGLPADIEDLKRYREEFGVEPVTYEAEPSRSSWPKGAYDFALSVARKLYV
ncbi:MAG: hypothetical protein U0Q15_09535 [Kineosporiaceae bacterium]